MNIKMCNESPQSSLWLLGVLFSILSSTCTNLGVNLQKYSFLCEAKRAEKERRSYGRQPKWACGLLMVVAGGLLDFVALGFAPQSLITPVGGFTMVANVFFAHYFLNETFGRSDAAATALIVAGVVQVALFADKSETCYTAEELVSFYSRTAFLVYAAVVGVLLVVFLCWVRHIEGVLRSCGPNSDRYERVRRIHPVLYPALSGLFGAQSVLFAKSTIETIKTFVSMNDGRLFTQFRTYFTACAMILSVFLQIHWLAKGLERFDAVFVVPIFQCFFITVSIVGGGVYFDEFGDMSAFQFSMFLLGVIITLAGVYLMSRREMNHDPNDSDDDDDETDVTEEEVEYGPPTDIVDADLDEQIVLMERRTSDHHHPDIKAEDNTTDSRTKADTHETDSFSVSSDNEIVYTLRIV